MKSDEDSEDSDEDSDDSLEDSLEDSVLELKSEDSEALVELTSVMIGGTLESDTSEDSEESDAEVIKESDDSVARDSVE